MASMNKEEEADARNIKLVRYTHASPQSWKGRDGLEKSKSLPIQQKKKSEGRLMDMLKSRSARFHNLTVNRSSSAGSKDTCVSIKKNQETCFLPIRTPNSVSRPNPIFPSPVKKLNLDTDLVPSNDSTNNISFTSKVKKMLEERRPQLNSGIQSEQHELHISSEGVNTARETTNNTVQTESHKPSQQWREESPKTNDSMGSGNETYDKEESLPRGISSERTENLRQDQNRLNKPESYQQDSTSTANEHNSIRSSLLKLFTQVETENRECGSTSNFELVQLLCYGTSEREEQEEKEEDDGNGHSLEGSVVAFEGELGPPEDPGTSRLEVVYLSEEEEERPRHRVLSPCSGMLRRPASPMRSLPRMTDPTVEKRKNDREVAINALTKLKDKTTFDKETFIQIIEKGVADYKPIAGNPLVSVTNDVCSVNNYETSHAYYYQQFDRRSKLAWISLHEPTTSNGSEPLKELWKSELLASLMSCTICFHRTPSSNLSPEQQKASDYQISQLKKLLHNKFYVRIAGSLDKKVDIVILHGQNEKILSDFFERKGNTSFHVWSLQRILNYLEDVGVTLQEWDIRRDAQDRELIVDIPLSEDSIEEDINDSTEEEEPEKEEQLDAKRMQEAKKEELEKKERGQLLSENSVPNLSRQPLEKMKPSHNVEEEYVDDLLLQASNALDKRDHQLKAAHNIILALSKDVMHQEIQITSLAGQLENSKKQLAQQTGIAEEYKLGMAEQEIEMAQLRSELAKKKSKKSYRIHKNFDDNSRISKD